MKKKFLLTIISIFVFSIGCVRAYDINNLPKTMRFAEAIEINSSSEITQATITNLADLKSVDISVEKARVIFDNCADMDLERVINPHPFSGIVIDFVTDAEHHVFCLDSGVQIGKYGSYNYMCYAPKMLNEYLVDVKSMYYNSTEKRNQDNFYINDGVENQTLSYPAEEWAYAAIDNASTNGMLPYELSKKYNDNITREEFCILTGEMIAAVGNYRSLSEYIKDNPEKIKRDCIFMDCNGVDESVGALYGFGIINGKSDTEFEPDAPVTREEAAKILCNAALHIVGENHQMSYIDNNYPLQFADTGSVADWARYYVKWVSQKWIMNGDNYNNFNPKSYYTVEQAIVTLNRLFKSVQ